MENRFTFEQVISAMQSAEREHPAPAPYVLSRPVSKLADIYGLMAYKKMGVVDLNAEQAQLVSTYLAKAEERA